MKIFGTTLIKATGFEEQKLLDDIKNECKVISLNKKNDAINIEVGFFDSKKAINLCKEQGFVVEILREKGIAFTAIRYLKRYGLLLGIAISLALIIYFSNIVMRIDIVGTSDTAVLHEITGILNSQGVSPGSYIPKINFTQANFNLTKLCDKIAWSSISHSGSVIKVEVALVTPKEETEDKRIPSNIVAQRDGVIVKAEVLSGILEVLVGDAVAKGDLLVSGVIERRNGVTYYYHSFGNILAEYEDEIIINQNYNLTQKSYGDTHYTKSLRIFDADFDLPRLKFKTGNYDIASDTVYLYFFGIKLPIGITTKAHTEVVYDNKLLSTEQAFYEAYRLLDNYEKNILKNEEIVARNVEEIMTEQGVQLKVRYKLIGEIGVQQEIFAK